MSPSPAKHITHITVRGARQHNLRDVNVSIPRNTLTVVTGLSGSGKSSLAFDTIYAEGQRRYVETLSAYARQFLDQMERPDVDAIDGLSPAISIEQKTTSRSPRSTVGTITEIYDYLRLLYASVGQPHCPNCARPISRQTAEQIVERIAALAPGERITVFAPIVRGRKGEFREELEALDQQGFRARIDGEMTELTEGMRLEKRRNHTVEAVVDRIILKHGPNGSYDTRRLETSVSKALQMANGLVLIGLAGPTGKQEETLYSSTMACPECGINVPKLEPRSFSFNSTYGACPECHGLGSIYDFDPAKTIVDWSKPLLDGAMGPGSASQYLLRLIKLAADRYEIDLKLPFEQLTEQQQHLLLYGPPKSEGGRTGFHGIFNYLRDNLDETKSEDYRDYMMQFMSATTCPTCHGRRLRPESLAVTVNGTSIADFTALPLDLALTAARSMHFTGRDRIIANHLQQEIIERLEFLNAVGLNYIALDRSAATLSGGEGQRIRLATQIGSRLRGVLYVLDEPSIGLHQRDNERLIAALIALRDLGNTVLVVEHDEDTIRKADYVLDLGPGAGRNGGHLIASGTPQQVMDTPASLTGQYLSGTAAISPRTAPRPLTGKWLTVEDATSHNLRHVTAHLPIGVMTVVTGVSGSGKSTLIHDILYRALRKGALHGSREEPGTCTAPSAAWTSSTRSSRSTRSPIRPNPTLQPRHLHRRFLRHPRPLRHAPGITRARLQARPLLASTCRGGRCEACQGEGQRRIEMNFLPDVYVLCEVCNGRRYNQETLAVRFNGYSIADLLDLSIAEAVPVLKDIPNVASRLETLVDVGLGYIRLGQSATTLSGGEAQRMKLRTRGSPSARPGQHLYLLDEPTTGLHFDDVRKLLEVLHRLTSLGNTVIIIEHNLDIIRHADYILDLGPEGGEGGGCIVAQGRPEQIARATGSHTGSFLARYYNEHGGIPATQPDDTAPPTADSSAPAKKEKRAAGPLPEKKTGVSDRPTEGLQT